MVLVLRKLVGRQMVAVSEQDQSLEKERPPSPLVCAYASSLEKSKYILQSANEHA